MLRSAARVGRVAMTAARASAPTVRLMATRASGPSNAARTSAAVPFALVSAGVIGFAAVSMDNKVDYDAVRQRVIDIFDEDQSRGPLFVRLAWHAAGTYCKHSKTGGSCGATMRYAPESGHGANAGLGLARSLLEPVKQEFPGISYADLWVLAAVTVIEEMGGPSIKFRAGRTDAPSSASCPPDGRLPDAAQGASHVRDIFYRMGFNDREIVALCGAHALGECHTDRSGFSGPWTRAPTTFSNEFFREMLETQWTPKKWSGPDQYEDPTGELMMLPTDLALRDDPKFREYVELYARDEDAFFDDFARAFRRLVELGVDFPKPTGRRRYLLFGPRDN